MADRHPDSLLAVSLTVVVVTYNSADCIGACLEAIETHLPDAERIVVDNGSSDGSSALVSEFSPTTRVIAGRNVGFGQGCNLGVRAATNRHVLLLNPDVVVSGVE